MVHVNVSTLDEVVGRVRDVIYAKIDAQGHDFEVLFGAAHLIRSHRLRRVTFEVSPGPPGTEGNENTAAAGYKRVVHWLTKVGYTCFTCVNRLRNYHHGPWGIGGHSLGPSHLIDELVDELMRTHLYTSIGNRYVNIAGYTDITCMAPGIQD